LHKKQRIGLSTAQFIFHSLYDENRSLEMEIPLLLLKSAEQKYDLSHTFTQLYATFGQQLWKTIHVLCGYEK
jgi:hypothetical protein